MRRALADIVPREILDRRRKAYVTQSAREGGPRGFRAPAERGADSSPKNSESSIRTELEHAVQNAEQGRDVATVPLLRTLALEDWLRSLRDYKKRGPDQVSLRSRAVRVVP